MKEFVWAWIFWASVVFCGLLAFSMGIAYLLYSTSPQNIYTPVFAFGFGSALGFFGLGALLVFVFDRFSTKNPIFKEVENEFFNKVIKEMPFFFFAMLYFFAMAIYMGLFLLVMTFIRNSFA
ncbi:MAG TPA: hypothetical protein PLM07_10655 [Candidatus Rifleibacterium sp.]|nr:hypothetical protein [Candidatus Rifleibacterium sp.]HPT46351.1 hypothetical protein [Candidatus Rifleibacterium sp.]